MMKSLQDPSQMLAFLRFKKKTLTLVDGNKRSGRTAAALSTAVSALLFMEPSLLLEIS
jgi:hypothetical protein